jgi:hypothetical protein
MWLIRMLVAIGFEEREMRARSGAEYRDYCRRVPRLIPTLWKTKNPREEDFYQEFNASGSVAEPEG